jgi:hypothetical protein
VNAVQMILRVFFSATTCVLWVCRFFLPE